MSKLMIHTYDVFDVKANNVDWYDFCHKKALKAGLRCKCYIEDWPMKLELWGSKKQFIKYYLATITKSYKFDGIKRLLDIISTTTK